MVFPETSYRDLYTERYDTYAEALAGHNEVVRKLTAGTLELYGENDDN